MLFRTLLSTLLLITAIGCTKTDKKDTHPSNCSYTHTTALNYSEDCERLLFRKINGDTTHPDYNSPYFDQSEIDELLGAIQAIKDLNIPQTDSVFFKHGIHVFPDTGLHQLHLLVDTTYAEGRNLIRASPSGNLNFDSLMSSLNFGIHHVNTRYNEVTLHSPVQYNIIAVARLFEKFPFVVDIDLNYFIGYPDDIELKYTSSHLTFDFSHGWGDCLSGCIYRKHWVFQVDKECNARFITSFIE